MAKLIKRVGIVILMIVVTCLLLISSMLVINVTEDSNKIASADNQINISTEDKDNGSSYDNMVAEIPTADNEFVLTCTCPEKETCTCGGMAKLWYDTIMYSITNNVVVKVTLEKDWIAPAVDNHSFGTGIGFGDTGAIYVPSEANIIMDLNGKTIDRKLQTKISSGMAIYVSGSLTLIDNCYDADLVKDITSESQLDNLPFGKITGGQSSETNSAGGITINIDGQLNIYGGMIVSNSGGVFGAQNSVINIYDGIIAQNISAGVITRLGSINLYSGYIMFNQAASGAGIGCFGDKGTTAITGYLNMYGGKIAYNHALNYGGGVSTHDNAIFNMYAGEITNNLAENDSGGVLLGDWSTFNMHGGKISHNRVEHISINNNNGGGAVMIVSNSTMVLYDGEISYNEVVSKDSTPVAGGAILLTGNGGLSLKGGVIKNNSVNFEDNAIGGGVCARDYGVLLTIGGGVQIFDNTANGKASDLYLIKKSKLGIDGLLANYNQIAHVGIDLAEDFGDGSFTHGYNNSRNRNIAPSRYFFVNADSKIISTNTEDSEVMVKDGEKVTKEVVWTWTGRENGNTTKTNATVTYSGESFTLTCLLDGEKIDFYRSGVSGARKEYSYIDNVGNYAFYTNGSCANPVFTLTVLQKQVDVLWKDDNFVYNGGAQKPTAYIAEDKNCKVITVGEQINAGNGFIASATEISNKNYKINPLTMNKAFSIARAKLAKPFGSGSFEYNGAEKEFIPNGYNLVTMNITGNKATEVGSYNAVVSIKDKHNYEWLDGTNEDITLSYAITLAPPVNEETGVYRFIYLAEEGDKQVRKTYKESGLVHGINDSEVNGGKAVIGNIAPNTSVKEFIETLGFDTSKIVLKDNKGKDIYKNNAPVDSATYDNKYELAVGTGWRVEYTNNGNTETIYLSVLGDVTGDGRISAVDVTYLRQIANDKDVYDNLSVEKKLASLVLNVGIVTTADAEIIRNIMDNKLSINLFY